MQDHYRNLEPVSFNTKQIILWNKYHISVPFLLGKQLAIDEAKKRMLGVTKPITSHLYCSTTKNTLTRIMD